MTMTEFAAPSATGPNTDPEPPIDEELLAEAQRNLNGSTPNAAINAALEMFVMHWRERRRTAMAELRRMSDEGLFDYSRFDGMDE